MLLFASVSVVFLPPRCRTDRRRRFDPRHCRTPSRCECIPAVNTA